MKIHIVLAPALFCILMSFCFTEQNSTSTQITKPALYKNNFSQKVENGEVINCRKVKDIGVVLFLNQSVFQYDLFKIEFHRFGSDADEMVAQKIFLPESKEYKKFYADKDSLKLNLFLTETEFVTSDFELNTLAFKKNNFVNDVFCTYKTKENNYFYLVIKGYKKTGRQTTFGDEIYDKGIEISERSSVFKNREDAK